MSATNVGAAALIVRHIALLHAKGDDHKVYSTLEQLGQENLSVIRKQLEFLAEATASVQRRRHVASEAGNTDGN